MSIPSLMVKDVQAFDPFVRKTKKATPASNIYSAIHKEIAMMKARWLR
jgi:hypothetical protein